jgi:tetratricopeptide (TPR) repeat protein
MRHNTSAAAVGVALLLITVVGDLQAAPRLSRSDFYRYRTWVRAHEAIVDAPAPALPFPGAVGVVSNDTLAIEEGRLLTAAKSLGVLEDFLVREWKRAGAFTADQNLSTARSYRDVGEYDEALVWYRRAASASGGASSLGPEFRHETFAVAVVSGDSLQVTRELLNLVGLKDLSGDERTVELAVRWLVAVGDESNLDHLMRKVESQLSALGTRLQFWHAYVQAVEGDRDGCLTSLDRLLHRAGAAEGLPRDQREWILRTYADLHYLADRRDDALRLYNLLAELEGEAGGWGRYQLANHHLLAGDYAAAGELYESFCDRSARGTWVARACEMAVLTAQLDEIRKEGEPYGTDVIHGR